MENYNQVYRETVRLEGDMHDDLEVLSYLFTRARQLLRFSIFLSSPPAKTEGGVWYCWAYEMYTDTEYLMVLLKKDQRNRGMFLQTVAELRTPRTKILIFDECDIQDFLIKTKVPCQLLTLFESSVLENAYSLVGDFYGDTRANRTNVLNMNHIDEGLGVLSKYTSDENTLAAFCLHPLFDMERRALTSF